MKKALVLTSCLALTACFGGGGNGVTTGGATNEAPRAATLLGAANSNTGITSVASAVVVKNDGSYVNTARAASTPDTTTYAGYTIYKLDNVDFKVINDEGSATFNFDIDSNGRIASATLNGESVARDTTEGHTDRFYGKTFQLIDSDEGDEEQLVVPRTASMTQTDLDNEREAYLANKISGFATLSDDDKATERAKISWNYLEQSWDFDSNGMDAGLTYSDFGTLTSTNVVKKLNASIDENGVVQGTNHDSDHESNMLFTGGYAIDGTTIKDTLTPTTGATYTGKATGVVTTSIKTTGGDRSSYLTTYNVPKDNGDSWSDDAGLDMTQMFATNNATLKIQNDGTQKLTMPFNSQSADSNKFYDVEITMNAAGDDVTNAAFKDTSDDNVIRTSLATSPYRVNPNATLSDATIAVTSGFYGVNSADEATGAIRYYTTENLGNTPAPESNPVTREWEFQGAWGLKKD